MIHGIGNFYIKGLSATDYLPLCTSAFSLSEELQLKTYNYFDSAKQVLRPAEQSLIPKQKKYILRLNFEYVDFLNYVSNQTSSQAIILGTPVVVKASQAVPIESGATFYATNLTTGDVLTSITSGIPNRDQYLIGASDITFSPSFPEDIICYVYEEEKTVNVNTDAIQDYQEFIGVVHSTSGNFYVRISKMQQLDYINLSTNSIASVSYVVLDKSIKMYKLA